MLIQGRPSWTCGLLSPTTARPTALSASSEDSGTAFSRRWSDIEDRRYTLHPSLQQGLDLGVGDVWCLVMSTCGNFPLLASTSCIHSTSPDLLHRRRDEVWILAIREAAHFGHRMVFHIISRTRLTLVLSWHLVWCELRRHQVCHRHGGSTVCPFAGTFSWEHGCQRTSVQSLQTYSSLRIRVRSILGASITGRSNAPSWILQPDHSTPPIG